MAKTAEKTQRNFQHAWFFREWAELARPTQADLMRAKGWPKLKMSDVGYGRPYTQAMIDEVSDVPRIRPFELLLRQDEAERS